MYFRLTFFFMMLTGTVFGQNASFEDPYGNIISSISDIDKELFYDIVEEIFFEIEGDEFEGVYGDEIIDDDSTSISTVSIFVNHIDMPAQFTNSFVYNDYYEEVRLIYNFGPSQKIRVDKAKEWFQGLVKLFSDGNEERGWDLFKKEEIDVAGLPERTTFFDAEDADYSLNYAEIYYTKSLDLLNKEDNVYSGRVVVVFVFPIY